MLAKNYVLYTTASELQQMFAGPLKMISSLLSIKICVYAIDNGNNKVRGGGVERDVGGN